MSRDAAHDTRVTLALLLARDLVTALDAGVLPDEEERRKVRALLEAALRGNGCQAHAVTVAEAGPYPDASGETGAVVVHGARTLAELAEGTGAWLVVTR